MFGGMGQGMNGLCLSFDGLDRLGFLGCCWFLAGRYFGGLCRSIRLLVADFVVGGSVDFR